MLMSGKGNSGFRFGIGAADVPVLERTLAPDGTKAL